MKKLLLLLGLFGLSAHAQLRDVDKTELVIKNYSPNPGGEKAVLLWTTPLGGTKASETSASNVRNGKGSVSFDAANSTEYLGTPQTTIPDGVGACLAEFYYKGFGTADIRVTVKDNATNTLGGYTAADTSWTIVNAATTWTRVQIPFLCPGSATPVEIDLEAQGNAAIGYVDDVYIGRDFRIGNVSAPGLVASGYFAGNTNCASWTRTNTALGAFASDSDCPGPTVEYNPGIYGTLQTTDADLPKFTINNLAPGEYEVGFIGGLTVNTSSQTIYVAVNDGTTTTPPSFAPLSAITGTGAMLNVIGRFSYTSAANRTFELYGGSAANQLQLKTLDTNQNLYFYVRRWPSATEVAVRGDVTDLSGSIKYAATLNCSWQNTGALAAYSADTDCPTPTVTGNITAPATKIPGGIAKTILPGTYLVLANSFFYATASSASQAACTFELYDGTNSGGLAHIEQTVTSYKANSMVLAGTFTYTAKQSNVQFEVRARRDTGNGSCRIELETVNDFVLTLIPLSQSLPKPFIAASTFCGRTGLCKWGSADLNIDAGSAITENLDGMISAVANLASGASAVTLTTGFFSAAPRCFATRNESANTIQNYELHTPTSTSVTFKCREASSSSSATTIQDCTSSNLNIFCVGAP